MARSMMPGDSYRDGREWLAKLRTMLLTSVKFGDVTYKMVGNKQTCAQLSAICLTGSRES